MRTFAGALLATALLANTAIGAPLEAGKPAGVKQAQAGTNGLLLIAGIAVVGLGIGLVASSGSGNGPSVSSTATGSLAPAAG